MTTHNPLRDHLKAQSEPEVTLSFDEVTKLLEPTRIPTESGWWEQRPNLDRMNEEVRSVGYIGKVDRDTKTITFRKIGWPAD